MRVARRISVVVATLVAVAVFGGLAPNAYGGGVDGGQTTSTVPATTVAPTLAPTTVPRTVPTLPTRPTTPPATTATTAPATTELTEEGDEEEPDASATTIALIVGTILALLLILLVVVLIRRRRTRGEWSDEARAVVGEGQRLMSAVVNGLSRLSQPAAAAHTWSEVDSDGADLHRRLRALAQRAPDQAAASTVTRADQALQGLRSAVESDRGLRMGPPPPTDEQLGYSEAVLRERASEFEHALEDLDALLRETR
ncbi:MAG: hypothetical protein M3179_01575 [Actinomycetota bacterium]|nr:hypothetical protein [Actinomycetota bacterium]